MTKIFRLLKQSSATLTGSWVVLALVAASFQLAIGSRVAYSQPFEDINPDFSDTHDNDPDGATGGRVNHVAVEAGNTDVMYAASEWGGLYKSTDAGLTWSRLDGHLPTATWDVEVDPSNVSRIYATSFFDGKTDSTSGINVSTDGGATWTHPATANPPASFCANSNDQDQLTAFGIDIDPASNNNVFVGTSCGLAVSNNSGATWTYRDPTDAPGSADRIWDVLALGGGVVHVCGDDGHLRSDDGGMTWVSGSGLPSGRCSLAVSPDESYVLLAVVGTTIYETDDAAAATPTWTQTRTNPSPQGRIPFVATNQRSDAGADDVFDLWFGDVSLYRVQCTSSTAPGGSPRCGSGNTPPWAGGFTRSWGGHDDMGDILFDAEVAVDACPVLMSSDGGVYRNTDTTADCHNPNWDQPDVTPHGLWPWSMSAADRTGVTDEDLYFGNQDNGLFGTTDGGGPAPTWHNAVCCDGFDTGGDDAGGIYTICCYGGGRSTRAFRTVPGFFSPSEINYPSSSSLPGFKYPESVVNYGDQNYVMINRGGTGGVFITANIDANPIAWTELGAATEPNPNSLCGVYVGVSGTTPTFYAHTGNCNSRSTTDRLYRFTGTNPLSPWTEVFLPSGGFGVVAVNPANPNRIIASGLVASDGAMYSSTDGGNSWDAMPELDALMTGNGAFPFRNQRGPSEFTGFSGYWQPSMVAFDPASSMIAAGGQDSGVFLSVDDGASWILISDPYTSDTSGTPHIPRPRYGYFDSEAGAATKLVVGSQGRGIWRIGLTAIFNDRFESGDTSAWSATIP